MVVGAVASVTLSAVVAGAGAAVVDGGAAAADVAVAASAVVGTGSVAALRPSSELVHADSANASASAGTVALIHVRISCTLAEKRDAA